MKHKHADLTEWFPAHIKPARQGVYQQMCGFGRYLGYQHWNGQGWGEWRFTPEQAELDGDHSAHSSEWRGLAAEPTPSGDEQTDDCQGSALIRQEVMA